MFIKVQLDASRQQGKESDVYLKGVLIPKREVHKKIGRCNVPVMKGLQCKISYRLSLAVELISHSTAINNASRFGYHCACARFVYGVRSNNRAPLAVLCFAAG